MSAFLLIPFLLAQPKDDVFDLPALLAPPLNVRILKATEKAGIVTEEVRFFSEKDGDKVVDIFALFSYPKGARNLPAFVWNQGGLYQATPHFTELGARRGYAALCIDFPIAGYRSSGGYPINSGLELPDNPRQAPIYHGAVALLRAVSFLQSRTEVDKDRIGMAGSSWGGFYTTLMIGVDPRLKAGASMFGSGSLHLGNNWWDGAGPDPKRNAAFRARWKTTLDPSARLAKSKTPIAWFTGTNDLFYWLPAVLDTYREAGGPKHLALLPNFDHALTPELDEQVFVWLDIHLKGETPFLDVSPPTREAKKSRTLTWTFDGKRKIDRAEVCVSFGPPGNWHSRYWLTLPARIEGTRCIVDIPPTRQPAFAFGSVIDGDGFRSSTPPLLLEGDPKAPRETLPYNGVAMWQPWSDKKKMEYLQLHGLPIPKIDADGAARFTAGKHALGPVYFSAGVRHRFTFQYEGGGGKPPHVALVGNSDGKMTAEGITLKPGETKGWETGKLEFTPPPAAAANLRVIITVHEKGTLRIRNLRLEPLP